MLLLMLLPIPMLRGCVYLVVFGMFFLFMLIG
jgi:hypothetical protein